MTESKAPGIMAFDMDAKAEEFPDFKVLTFDNSPYPDETLTYGDLVTKGRKLAREMAERGIGEGDTFSIVMRTHHFLAALLHDTFLTPDVFDFDFFMFCIFCL